MNKQELQDFMKWAKENNIPNSDTFKETYEKYLKQL